MSMIYKYKKSLGDKEQTITLEDTGITISEFEKIRMIPYNSIKRILLKYNNSRFRRKEYICKIISEDKPDFTFTSKFYSGIGNFYDQGSEYRSFILELHKKIADFTEIEFSGGIKSFLFWTSVVLSGILLFLFSFIFISFWGIMGIILPLIFFIKLTGYFYHNRPVKYNPYHNR